MSIESLEKKFDRQAKGVLSGRQETPPEGEFDRVMEFLDNEKKRNTGGGWWWSAALSMLLMALVLAYSIYTERPAPQPEVVDHQQPEGEALASNADDVISANPIESHAFAEGKALAGNSLLAGFVQPVEYLEQPDKAVSAQHNEPHMIPEPTQAIQKATSSGLQAPDGYSSNVSVDKHAESSPQLPTPVAPEEFNIEKLMLSDVRFDMENAGASASVSSLTPDHVSVKGAYSWLDEQKQTSAESLRSQEVLSIFAMPAKDFPTLRLSNKLSTFTCPAFSLKGDRELRMQVYGGPRFDRKVFSAAAPADASYLVKRETLEREVPGVEIGIRGEVGRASGPFLGLGVQYAAYNSRFNVLGPLRSEFTSKEVRDENGTLIRIDTATIFYRDTTRIQNRHNTMTFFGTGGYRHQLKKISIYVAADLGFEVVTESAGVIATRDGIENYSVDADNWINKRPGFTIGGRAGMEIPLLRTLAEDPSDLGLLVEVNTRNTGVFSGKTDVLSYRYSRVGFTTGLRYTF